MDKIKVMICDDMAYVIQCFSIILNNTEDICIVDTATSQEELMEKLKACLPDILLLDIQMNYSDEGIVILQKVKELYPIVKVIMMSVHEEDAYIFRSFSLGACDYVIKSDDPSTLVDTIRNAYNDKISLNPYISQKIVSECLNVRKLQENTLSLLNCIALLTTSEYKVLQMLYKGYTYAQIAEMRFVEEVTVRSQVNKILKKFNKRSMRELLKQLKEIQFFDFKMTEE